MEAIVLSKIAESIPEGIDSLELREAEKKSLAPTEVRIKVRAAALNFFDLLILVGKYQHRAELPHVPGSEAAGVICEVGSEAGPWRMGDEVMFLTQGGGGLQSHVVTDVTTPHALFPKPALFSFAEAAGFPVGFMTGYHGLVQRGHLKAGEVLLVTGAAGGMSLAAIQLGRALGATVVAAASSAGKLEQARRAGAHHVVNYQEESLKTRVEEITGGAMADVCYEVVGGKVFKECVRCMASNGRLLVVGFASGEIPSLPANLVLIKGFQLVGVRSGAEMLLNPDKAAELWAQMRLLTRDRLLAPVVRQWPTEGFKDAFRSLWERRIIGKAIVLWNQSSAKL